MNTLEIIDLAIDAVENGYSDEALLHLYHARIHAMYDAKSLTNAQNKITNLEWEVNPDRTGT